MAKVFRAWDVEQSWLLPPSVQELVPPGHTAHFIRNLVRDELDLEAIYATYDEERGFPPYHPAMMTALLLYGYTQGLFSSRKIARACEERVDFMAVTAMQRPDFRTIAKFRLRHLDALSGLFVQVLRLCQRAGLVRLGHVSVDGTKVKANASKHKAMSYKRMKEAEPKLAAEVQAWFDQSASEDARDDEALADRRGDELPAWVANRKSRLEKIREAKAALEAEAKQAAAADHDDSDDDPPISSSPPHTADGTPTDKAQRNFTDPESRILKTSEGYSQGYNAQAAVDADHQVIVAQFVVAAQNDCQYLPRLLDEIRSNTGRQAEEVSADAGYCSEANLRTLARRGISAYVATGRQHRGERTTRFRSLGPLASRMATRIARGAYRSRYRLRKVVVEPVFGQIKNVLGFTRFLLRGLRKVTGEFSLVAIAHNLRKLAAAR
jgi:transposase